MLGEVEPLKALHDAFTREEVVERILKEFPERILPPEQRVPKKLLPSLGVRLPG